MVRDQKQGEDGPYSKAKANRGGWPKGKMLDGLLVEVCDLSQNEVEKGRCLHMDPDGARHGCCVWQEAKRGAVPRTTRGAVARRTRRETRALIVGKLLEEIL